MKKFSVFLFLLLFSFCLNLTAGVGDSTKTPQNAGAASKPSVVKKNIEVIINGVCDSTITIDSGGIVPSTIWEKYKPHRPCDSLIIDTSRVQQDSKIFVDYVPGFVFKYVRIAKLIVILISLSFAGAFFLFIKYFYRSKKHIFPAEPEKSPAIDIGGELLKLRNAIKQLNGQNVFLDKQHKALTEKIGKLEALLQQITDDISRLKKDVYHTPPPTSPSVLYAKSIVDNCLCNVTSQPNGNTIFELHLNGANQAELCLYSGALKRIVANPAFIDGCDKQVINNDKNVEVRSTGLVRKDPISGRWQVIRKMDILIK